MPPGDRRNADTTKQLELAYASAGQQSMKVFISFDFNWWQTDQAVEIGEMIARFAPRPAQLIVDNKVFASTFAGDGLDVPALRAAAGIPLFFAPNFDPGLDLNVSSVDGLFNWMAWPHNGRNKAPTPHNNISVGEGDQLYINTLAGKAYIAREYSDPPNPGPFDAPCADRPKAVSPWFFTHFGPEVSYSKNWIFPADLLWYDRWREILAMQPRFVEIVTWNDYGESHYTGSLHAPHTDNGASKPHDGWATMAKPFIAAFKAGASSPDDYITSDRLIYWYRPALRGQDCDSTDTCMAQANNRSGDYFLGRPDGWQSVRDSVFVVSLLRSPASIQIGSGGSLYQYAAPAGASSHEAPMSPGEQSFSISRDGTTILAGVSLKPIIDGCVCGLYNFNAYGNPLIPKPAPGRSTIGSTVDSENSFLPKDSFSFLGPHCQGISANIYLTGLNYEYYCARS
ncbi:Glycoside hydrolase family 71 [Penicillium brevicompactum]|uniref:Glycoside hydrolase family 71 n=1 Tax=Penicillium brevicompactum TaxID=5074 RepID=UPI0025424914|nr:Glycoside hydrolase family 71 [Penicillium brevicompactum]KAJ5335775.1 Glycoside hydrolase family 71 [Penicillium brevicompactum]